MKKHSLKIILGCLVSIILIWLCIRNIDFKQSISLIKNANISLIFVGVLVYAFSYVVRSIRWEYILIPLKKIKIFGSFFFLIFGFFMNNILPLRLGEFVRALVAGEKLKISKSSVFATIVVERLMDVIIFIIAFFLIGMFVPNIPGWLQKSFILCAIIFGLAFIVLFFMSKDEEKFLKILYKFHLPQKLNEFIKSIFLKFASGLKFFQNKKLVFNVFLTSVIVWYIEAWAYKIFFMSFGVDVSIIQCLFVIVTTGIATMLPTAPAFIGAIEGVGMVTLGLFGISETMAFTSMAATHFVEMMTVYALGVIGIIKERISFSDLFKFAVSEQKVEDKNEK
ncbi:MAG: flippase-like domain-containing protein [Elusimicrobia bacterium]|nr:flippase-like domain-containing protein [Elusimicrobiota bacterium]